MKKFRVLLFGAVLCLFLAGCGKSENKPIEQKIRIPYQAFISYLITDSSIM